MADSDEISYLHAMPIGTLPSAGEIQPEDECIAYRKDTGKAYLSTVGDFSKGVQDIICAEFSAMKDYVANDFCIYDGKLWKFLERKASGDWDPGYVVETTIAQEITNILNDKEDE